MGSEWLIAKYRLIKIYFHLICHYDTGVQVLINEREYGE